MPRCSAPVGTSNRVLKVVSKLEQVECDAASNTTFKLVVTNGRNNALEVTKANFAVKADRYLAYQNDKLQVTSPDALSHQVKKGETVTYYVTAKGLNALTDGPVDLYLLSRSGIQRVQRQLGADRRRLEVCDLSPNILVKTEEQAMSYTFSRRAFLKYSAATAVAVAGASLLGGCEYQDPNNPVSKALPSAITSELQVIGGLRGLKIENGTCTMEVDIESGRANPIPLDPYRFSLAIKDAEGKAGLLQRKQRRREDHGRREQPDREKDAHHAPS